MIEPGYSDFERIHDAGAPQVVWTRLVADLETPVSAMLKIAEGRPNSFLLESVEGGDTRGRYSIIDLKPDIIWRAQGDKAAAPVSTRKPSSHARKARSPRCAPCSMNRASNCPRACRPWRRAFSAIWVMTWCA